ncbi:DNA polymerase III subunit delta [Agarivorans sp. Toyoura001]|uniref:DNA polymerase III subunit delta n=1 Tax=Agarivorans sp. Toyoura001 TaxID=2283141 RepID=UPI0010CFF3D0|nr:DNA polymerase III subunit delta [Agarivorans sp. Toyoura001]GDY24344.1 DNA polymerase III subunit delta [Agarivorans sp. Toyoura001]
MKIYADRLSQQNAAKFSCYLVAGEEPLIKIESIDSIRQQLQQQGLAEERLKFTLDAEFQWSSIFDAMSELSLFSQYRLIELQLDRVPDKAIQNQLDELLPLINPETRLLLSVPKVTKANEKQNWYKFIDQQGLVVMIYPPEGGQLHAWVRQRLAQQQLPTNNDLIALLVHYYEGNLLALSQAINNIALRWGQQLPPLKEIEAGLSHANHFSSFQLVDALLAADFQRSLLIIKQLQLEGEEPTLINWGLDKEFKLLQLLQEQPTSHHSSLFKQHGVWNKRQGLISSAAKRYSAKQINQARLQVAAIDQAIKQFAGDLAWHQLERLVFELASPSHEHA